LETSLKIYLTYYPYDSIHSPEYKKLNLMDHTGNYKLTIIILLVEAMRI